MSGPLESSITLEEVFAVVSAKRVPLAPELAGYLALEIAEGAGGAPGEVDPRQVYIGDEGTVALVRQKRAEAPMDKAEESIRGILLRLLDVSGSQTPALDAAAKKEAGSGIASLAQELEAALVPVNRAAGRRALARLAREVKRVTLGVGRNASVPPNEGGSERQRRIRGSQPSYSGSQAPPASQGSPGSRGDERPSSAIRRRGRPRDEVDSLLSAFEVEGPRSDSLDSRLSRDLKEIAGLTPTPPPLSSIPSSTQPLSGPVSAPLSASRGTSVAAGEPLRGKSVAAGEPLRGKSVAASGEPLRGKSVAAGEPLRGKSVAASGEPPVSARTPAAGFPASTRESATRARATTGSTGSSGGQSAKSDAKAGAKRIGMLVVSGAVLVAGGLILAWILREGRTPAPLPAEKATVEAIPSAKPVRACKATVVISDAPARAELLVRAGVAPLEIPRMPVGARLEFVATAEGHAPKRGIVPAKALWDAGSGKPRYEMTIELERSRAKAGAVDNWPPGEPGSEVGGHGSPGTVHVVSTPRGAEIWLLAGLGPEATIDQLACDSDVDILVAGPWTFRKRLHIGQNEFVEVSPPGGEVARKARVSAK